MDRKGKIVRADHTGDSALATYEPGVENEASVVAQAELDKFMADCIRRFGAPAQVFGKTVEGKSTIFNPETDRIVDFETIMVAAPEVPG